LAFPATVTIDDGQRANENPLSNGGVWTSPVLPGDYNGQLATNVLQSSNTGWFSSRTTYKIDADGEMWGTITTTGSDFLQFFRILGPNTGGLTCYKADWQPTPNQVVLSRFVNNAATTVATLAASHNGGDTVGVRFIGNTFEFFVNGAVVNTTTDSTPIIQDGFLGIGAFWNTGDGWTLIGGGSLSSAKAISKPPFMYMGI
jgi:hypothetical protein